MPMPKTIHDKLTELLKDAKEGDKSLLEVIAGWQDAAEAKEKVQKANEEIIKEREALKAENKEHKTKLSDKESEIKRLQESMLTDDDRKRFDEFKKKGMTTDVEAKLNKLENVLETVNKALSDEKVKREIADKKALENLQNSERSKLNQELTSALTAVGIEGDNIDLALSTIDRRGLVKLETKEDGSIERKLYVYDDKGGILSASKLDEIAGYIAKKHENLVRPSGKGGSGLDHQTRQPPVDRVDSPQNLQQAQYAAADRLNKHFK